MRRMMLVMLLRFPVTSMLKAIFTAALLTGLLSGIAITIVQETTTTPLILNAENYEKVETTDTQFRLVAYLLSHSQEKLVTEETEVWGPENGIERFAYTTLANIVLGVGFALLLVASYAMHGGQINGRIGIIWGMAGFAVFTLSPSLGLPPEVPGSAVAELVARQGWWLAAAASTALGLWLVIFREGLLFTFSGLIIIALPHAIGAPHPDEFGSLVPAALASQFVASSIVISAIFWVMLGWLSGTFYHRYSAKIET
jgi:cobalt transporter subunit CbtA